jgi:hypothetical protein
MLALTGMRRREDKAAKTLLLRLFGRWHALSLRSTHARETGGMAAKMEQLQAELSGAESARQIQLLAMRQRMLVLAKARLLRLLTMLPPVVDVWSRHVRKKTHERIRMARSIRLHRTRLRVRAWRAWCHHGAHV